MKDPLLGGSEKAIDEGELVTAVEENVRILHIEDEQHFSNLVTSFLDRERDHFEVEAAKNPQDGLDYLNEADVDCIVSDYDMPGQNGLEVLEDVREDYPDVPFVLFTGKGSEEIASEAISKGVTEYLQKGGGTAKLEVLADRIETAVAGRRAEKQVARGFRAIETVHEGISLLDEDGLFVYVNEAYADITGYTREELLGESWEILYRDHEVDRVYEEMLPDARRDKWQGQTTYVRKNGELVAVDHRLAYTEDDTLICTIDDVSDVVEVREELSLKERAMNEAPVGITITDTDGENNPIIDVNDGFLELTRYPREEILRRDCRFLQGEQTREEPVAEMREAIDDAEPVTVELRNYRENGEMFWNRVTIAPILGSDENPEYFVGFHQDVTARKEEELERQQIVDRMTDAIVEVDSNWTLTSVDDRAEDFFEMDEKELLGRDFWDVSSETLGAGFEEEYLEVMETRDPASLVQYCPELDGWFDVHVYPEGDSGLAFYFQEVTERIEQSRELDRTQ